ncbi:MAG: acetylornithine deacetylase, partial [Pseudomonadota bacterium]
MSNTLNKLPNFQTMCAELVGLSTVSSLDPKVDQGNIVFIHRLGQWLEDIGFHVDIRHLPHNQQKANLLAYPKNTELKILFSGHSDTVPISHNAWQSDPFTLIEDGNTWKGLGICDMKAFFPLFIETIKPLLTNNQALPVGLLVTSDEETTMDGARFMTENLYKKPSHVIIGEPTDAKPISSHKGYLAYAIKAIGKSAHSSDPSAGINAIEVMHYCLEKLIAFQKLLEETYHDSSFKVPYPTLNLGLIQGGSSINAISDACRIDFEIRPIPQMSTDTIVRQLQSICDHVSAQCQTPIQLIPLYEPIPGFSSQKDSKLIEASEIICGCKADAVNFTTEASFFSAKNIDTLVLGPGSISQAHQ